MKHAILIMAHKNYSFLHHLIEYFERDCYVFVHIDKKSDITKEEIACLREMPQVTEVYQKYSVHWGGFSILKCELFMLKKALKKCNADYFHLISGQDYPIKPLEYFLHFFDEQCGKEFFQYVHLPHYRWENNTYFRFKYFFFYDFVKKKDKESINKITRFVDFQKKIGIKRRIPDYFEHLYGGSQWFSITCDAASVILKYTHEHPHFYRRLKYTFAPEECYISTVLKNELPDDVIDGRNMRLIRWKYENGNYPANLGKEHFHLLVESDSLFARKFDEPSCTEAIALIDTYLLKDDIVEYQKNGGWKYNGYLQYNYNEKLSSTIKQICIDFNLRNVLDIGCGAGIHVASLQRFGIIAFGCDANPYTPELFAKLYPNSEYPCFITDITNQNEVSDSFDLTLCLDVFDYIPYEKMQTVIKNISMFTYKMAIISYGKNTFENDMKEIESQLESLMKNEDMITNPYLTIYVNSMFRKNKISDKTFVFQKQSWKLHD